MCASISSPSLRTDEPLMLLPKLSRDTRDFSLIIEACVRLSEIWTRIKHPILGSQEHPTNGEGMFGAFVGLRVSAGCGRRRQGGHHRARGRGPVLGGLCRAPGHRSQGEGDAAAGAIAYVGEPQGEPQGDPR